MKKITVSKAIGEALHEEMLRDKNVFIMGEDMAVMGNVFAITKGFLEEFGPNRVIDTPISEEGFGKDLLCQAELVKLLVLLGRCPENALSPEPLMPRNPRVRQLLAFLDDHFTEELSIDDLARQFFVSKYHMMRLFREETGVTIHQYILHKRLMLARSYLASGMNATQSCYRSGFGSYSAFTRACARLLGRSPTGRATPEPDE